MCCAQKEPPPLPKDLGRPHTSPPPPLPPREPENTRNFFKPPKFHLPHFRRTVQIIFTATVFPPMLSFYRSSDIRHKKDILFYVSLGDRFFSDGLIFRPPFIQTGGSLGSGFFFTCFFFLLSCSFPLFGDCPVLSPPSLTPSPLLTNDCFLSSNPTHFVFLDPFPVRSARPSCECPTTPPFHGSHEDRPGP